MRVSEQAGVHRALFRVALDGRLDYHEYELARAPDGSVHIVDGLLFSVGERMSDSARRAAQVGLKNENQGVGDVLSGKEQRFDEGLAHFQRFQDLAKREQWSPALEEFEQLPADLLQLTSIGLLKVRVASHLSEQRWLAAVEEFRTAHPGDPALDLLLLQVHRARREFEPWLACIDRLDRKVGGDPYLQLERGDARFAEASLDRARPAVATLHGEPELEDAYWRPPRSRRAAGPRRARAPATALENTPARRQRSTAQGIRRVCGLGERAWSAAAGAARRRLAFSGARAASRFPGAAQQRS
jgi:hypothetical protein